METARASLRALLILVCLSILTSALCDSFKDSPRLYVESGIRHSGRAVAISADNQFAATGSLDRTIKLWRLNPPRELLTLPNNKVAYSLAFHPTEPLVASGNEDGGVEVWNYRKESLVVSFKAGDGVEHSPSVSFSETGDALLYAGGAMPQIRRWSLPGYAELEPILVPNSLHLTQLSLLGGGRWLAGMDAQAVTRILDTRDWKEPIKLKCGPGEIQTIAYAPRLRTLVTDSPTNGIRRWSPVTGELVASLGTDLKLVHSLAFSSDERLLACATESGDIAILRTSDWQESARLRSTSNRVEHAGFIDGGRKLAVQLWYDRRMMWDLVDKGQLVAPGAMRESLQHQEQWRESASVFGHAVRVENHKDYVRLVDQTQRELCTLIMLDKEDAWVVVTPDGRFDTNKDLISVEGVHWVMSKDPFSPLPLEIFMRQYFEPRLLPRLLADAAGKISPEDKLPSVRPIESLKRVQPVVTVKSVTADGPGAVAVTVKVENVRRADEGAGDTPAWSGAKDIRLFRDQQLVGSWPNSMHGGMVLNGGPITNKPKGLVFEHTFRRVQLPLSAPRQPAFTAYAFNTDDVRSEASPPKSPSSVQPAAPRRPRAYLISMGVSASQSPGWRLDFAAHDARKLVTTLAPRLRQFEVAPVLLTSEVRRSRQPASATATKQNLADVLAILAGRKTVAQLSARQRQTLPGVARLRRAAPEDLVLVFFSGHGDQEYREGDEQRPNTFYLFPYDIGRVPGKVTPPRPKCISSDELAYWLRDLDAGDVVLIIDACHAAAAVGARFKAGPLGSRGLGQLAYDKGMRLLAATQPDTTALEVDLVRQRLKIQQGLLTYALLDEALEGGKAGAGRGRPLPLSEWLAYAERRVPKLHAEVLQGGLRGAPKGVRVRVVRKGSGGLRQQPQLFDFSARLPGKRPLLLSPRTGKGA